MSKNPHKRWHLDREARAGYLVIDPTALVARTRTLQTDRDAPTLLVDYDERGNVLGIEVLFTEENRF